MIKMSDGYHSTTQKQQDMNDRAERIREQAAGMLKANSFGLTSKKIANVTGASPAQVARSLSIEDKFINIGTDNHASWVLRSIYEKIQDGGENV